MGFYGFIPAFLYEYYFCNEKLKIKKKHTKERECILNSLWYIRYVYEDNAIFIFHFQYHPIHQLCKDSVLICLYCQTGWRF